MELISEDYTLDDLMKDIEEIIPILFELLMAFIFIRLMYILHGKSKPLYWFTLLIFLVFDIYTIGFSVSYFQALDHALTTEDDTQL